MTPQKALRKLANPKKVPIYQRFFRTGYGEYAEGDIFLGLTVPQTRTIAKKFQNLELRQIQSLLRSKFHEERLLALIILVEQYRRGSDKDRSKIYKFYLRHFKWINNWDLVDTSAHIIVGGALEKSDRRIILKWARSSHLWTRRIAVLSHMNWIKHGDFDHFLKVAKLLLQDDHDLIHKAVGWLLREMGKVDQAVLVKFLNRHAGEMPRTMLRYSIEKFPPRERKRWMNT